MALRYKGDDEVERFLVGSIEERRDDLAVDLARSPLGQALMGRRHRRHRRLRGAPGGTLKVEIVDIEG